VSFVYAWDADAASRMVAAEADGAKVVSAFADAIADAGPLTKESFRAAAARTREVTGVKGRALFHPIRVAMTGWESGPELDLAIPAIDRVAGLMPGLPSCAIRARSAARPRASSA
jgi:hypothetical protein